MAVIIYSVRMLGDRVLVEVEKNPETAGNLDLPEDAREKPIRGRVVAVASPEDGGKQALKVGDCIVFSRFAGYEYEHPRGDKGLILDVEDVLMVLPGITPNL